ncbi:hypothetical protein LPAF129_02860 [Ligilactobacillus pabuli]|uniref:Uncharacterized protein n=1 Tax=Ligilactobacillus pabuli TaxID=2886039 RepID=A0ABQ5JEW1_9LACO|nr:hypothetical protein LPAF129_02860 [Ligilactobacillus pabuli]
MAALVLTSLDFAPELNQLALTLPFFYPVVSSNADVNKLSATTYALCQSTSGCLAKICSI